MAVYQSVTVHGDDVAATVGESDAAPDATFVHHDTSINSESGARDLAHRLLCKIVDESGD